MKGFLSLMCFILLTLCSAAQGIISTVAGGGGGGGDGSPATTVALEYLRDVYVDDTGNIYIVQEYNIRKVDAATGIINTIAGNGLPGFVGDSIPATQASLFGGWAIAFDKKRNYYIADRGNHRVRKVDAAGIITTVAGKSQWGYSGDGGPAKDAQLVAPADICFDTAGNLYIADAHYGVIRKVDTFGIITTIAGTGTIGTWTDGQTALNADLGVFAGICVDNAGNIYFADASNYKIGKINTAGIISTYAGDGTFAMGGDGGLAINAQLFASGKIRFDKKGNLFIADKVIRVINGTTGIITTVAGNGSWGFTGDGGLALNASLAGPVSIFCDTNNNLFIADAYNYRIRKVANVLAVPEIIKIELSVFPNPTSGIINLISDKPIDRVQITNLVGQVIYEADVKTKQFAPDIAANPAGVYVINVFFKEGVLSKKLAIYH